VPSEDGQPEGDQVLPSATPSSLTRWRSFNLVERFSVERSERNMTFLESDFDLARCGFDFVRLPMGSKPCDATEG
jgi:hypothetical protein